MFDIKEVSSVEATGTAGKFACLGLSIGGGWGAVILLGAALAC